MTCRWWCSGRQRGNEAMFKKGRKGKTALGILGLLLMLAPGWALAKSDKVTVTLTSPANNSSFTALAAIQFLAMATAKQKNHPIVQVQFFAGATLIGTVPGPQPNDQYAFTWTNVVAGNYTLTVQATNNKGDTAVSTAVTITVIPASAQVYYIYTDQLNTPRVI